MIRTLNKFFASKKIGVAIALLALAVAVSLQFSIVSLGIRNDLDAFCLGFIGLLAGFTHAYSDDVKQHKPIGKEFLSRIFFLAYVLFVLLFSAYVLRKLFSF